MLNALRRRIARMIAPSRKVQQRLYAGARQSSLTGGFGSYANGSADNELMQSLTLLRSRSRQLMRDAPYAKRARVIVVNNVVGAGVGLQALVMNTRSELHVGINADIEKQFAVWSCADSCHTGGAMHFADMERTLLAEVFTAGEALVRLHPRRFGESQVPLALEVIEADRIADELVSAPTGAVTGRMVMGVEVDEFGRALAYWIRDRHSGDQPNSRRSTSVTRVPADQIIHIRMVDRWPMTRGEPWLHTVLRKANDMDQYVGSELTAARMAANYFATLETDSDDPVASEKQDDGTKQMEIEPGMIDQLAPGDKLNFHAPNRPNTALDPFMRYMLREFAAGVGVSYESVSRDYSQSNYSSSRLALLDDRDLWRVLQQWWARSFRDVLHKAWIRQAVLARAIKSIPVDAYAMSPERYLAVRWKFRGWSWIDPTKEVEAYKEAVRAGFITTTQVIAMTGGGVDIEDVIAERKRELEMFDEADIDVDTTVADVPEPAEPAMPATPAAPADALPQDNPDDAAPPARVVSIAR